MTSLARPAIVTGGAGFIGSEVTRQLVEAGAEVIVVDNLVNGTRDNLKGLPDAGTGPQDIDTRVTVRKPDKVPDIDIQFIADQGQFISESDVDVAKRVFR